MMILIREQLEDLCMISFKDLCFDQWVEVVPTPDVVWHRESLTARPPVHPLPALSRFLVFPLDKVTLHSLRRR